MEPLLTRAKTTAPFLGSRVAIVTELANGDVDE